MVVVVSLLAMLFVGKRERSRPALADAGYPRKADQQLIQIEPVWVELIHEATLPGMRQRSQFGASLSRLGLVVEFLAPHQAQARGLPVPQKTTLLIAVLSSEAIDFAKIACHVDVVGRTPGVSEEIGDVGAIRSSVRGESIQHVRLRLLER